MMTGSFACHRSLPVLIAVLLIPLLLPGLRGPCAAHQEVSDPVPSILVFTRTTGFRHDSIPAGIAALRSIGRERGYRIEVTEDPTWFTPAVLERFRAVVFLNTSGDVLDEFQRLSFRAYIESGGGFVGVHAAADSEHGWPWYEYLVGTRFRDHPHVQESTIRVHDRSHPSTRHLPARWIRTDEWYNFTFNPRGRVHILATLDAATVEGGRMGADHPVSWCKYVGTGRSWYTAGGHTEESFHEPAFVAHLAGGIDWASGLAADEGLPGILGYFRPTTIAEDLEDPIAITWLSDERIAILQRNGSVTALHPASGTSEIIGSYGRSFDDNPEYDIRFRSDAADPDNPLLRAMLPSIDRPGRTDLVVLELGRRDDEGRPIARIEHRSNLRNTPESGWFLTRTDAHQDLGAPGALNGTILRPDPDRGILVLVHRDDAGRMLSAERFGSDLPWIHPFDCNQGPCGRIFVLDREHPDRSEAAFGRIVRLDWIGGHHPAAAVRP